VPANVYHAANSACVLSHHSRVVFHRIGMHHIRELGSDSQRLAEKKIQNVNAMRGDVEQRSASRLGGIDQPTAAVLSVVPGVGSEFGQDRLADRTVGEQLVRALHLRYERR